VYFTEHQNPLSVWFLDLQMQTCSLLRKLLSLWKMETSSNFKKRCSKEHSRTLQAM
ncbi:hypothetical protein HispidOSU_031441, partial [Sigmodon hispidus]